MFVKVNDAVADSVDGEVPANVVEFPTGNGMVGVTDDRAGPVLDDCGDCVPGGPRDPGSSADDDSGVEVDVTKALSVDVLADGPTKLEGFTVGPRLHDEEFVTGNGTEVVGRDSVGTLVKIDELPVGVPVGAFSGPEMLLARPDVIDDSGNESVTDEVSTVEADIPDVALAV